MTGLTVTFDNTYFTEADPSSSGVISGAVNPECPGVWDVAIGGHGYILDLGVNGQGGFRHESIPTLRPVFIEGDSLGEKDINPESLWRYSDKDWSHGAGQRRADLPNSDTSMFWQSKGIDCWTEWQIGLLPDTIQRRASANTNLMCQPVNNILFIADGASVLYLTGGTFTAITGLPGTTITGLCTDGSSAYVSVTGHGIYQISAIGTPGAATQLVTGTDTFDTIAYVNGRLMATIGPSIYNIVSATPAAKPTALFTNPNSLFKWVGFCEGQEGIYVAGSAGVTSQIYRIGIDSTGANLTVPILAAPDLLGGEIILAIGSYLGFVFLGTVTGVRMCIADTTGNLSVGALLTTGPTRCFSGYDRFVWFGWDNYDTLSTGLGRLDVTVEATNGAPAYASDLMVTAQAPVTDVCTFNGKQFFTVAGVGFYQQDVNLVRSGFLDSGLITYDIPDTKIAISILTRHVGSIEGATTMAVSADTAPFITVGSHDASTENDVYPVPQLQGESLEIRTTLTRDLTFTTLGPEVSRVMLLCLPNVQSGLFLYVPLQLSENVTVHGGGERALDVAAERAFLYSLRDSNAPVIYQELGVNFNVTVDDVTWQAANATNDYSAWNGTLVAKLKTL